MPHLDEHVTTISLPPSIHRRQVWQCFSVHLLPLHHSHCGDAIQKLISTAQICASSSRIQTAIIPFVWRAVLHITLQTAIKNEPQPKNLASNWNVGMETGDKQSEAKRSESHAHTEALRKDSMHWRRLPVETGSDLFLYTSKFRRKRGGYWMVVRSKKGCVLLDFHPDFSA